jgi:MinD superfamily P-loop ATPase
VAIASGKGGTGKTTVATNLASVAAALGRKTQLLDCDVEAPNAHLFLDPAIEYNEKVGVPVPKVDLDKCDACGECGQICRFSAIVSLQTKPLVFPELCHGCGGCVQVCPQGAITEHGREVGRIEGGAAGDLRFVTGKLRIGEAMAPPLIRAVKRHAFEGGLVFIDAPPGNSCPVIEAVRHSDYVVLVAEPTPFGLNDLSIAAETMRSMNMPFGVVVNRAAQGRDGIDIFCRKERIEMLAKLPDDRRVAEAYSRGELAVEAVDAFKEIFTDLLEKLEERVASSRAGRLSGLTGRE